MPIQRRSRFLLPRCRVAQLVTAAIAAFVAASAAFAAPDEDLLGKSRGYPQGTRGSWFNDESVRVGSFSNLDRILPHRVVAKSETPLPLPKSLVEPTIRYTFRGREYTLDDYLAHQRTTGLLVIRNGEILVERYQYERTPSHRFVSNSMAKSIVSLGIGIALRDRAIRSLDDKAADYVPELADNAYGKTSLRDLLRMSSGVKFSEDYTGTDDAAKFSRAVNTSRGSTIDAIKMFDEREVAAGTRFRYASIETNVLGLVLTRATGRRASDFVAEKIWQPLGAESDATWITASDGNERFAGAFSATLRDWGRFGILLANDGMRNGNAVLPFDYLIEATDRRAHPDAFAPKGRGFGYGYQFWTMGSDARRFALIGVYGQAIYVDPQLRLVLVHTAAAKNARIGTETMGPELRALWAGITESVGRQSPSPSPSPSQSQSQSQSIWP